ncbi:PREDICTED: trafficking protein particle complex subunit 8-like isoform X2 [Cyprinodon variegatus]|uniref:trafficking protein particle complex subunit 8-like isoform X2 n=1 Tax=Cyprinodon variegatus TaxID=28743 RepID=UPI000742C2B4|nr:PREDICTED: trafficking protein particle complex subunit 8-like isoform X2 [Cyprinodon variegatus]
MKQRYGPQGCYLLKINSRSSSPEEGEQIPDPWSQYLHKQNPRNQDSVEPAANAAAPLGVPPEADCRDSAERDPGPSTHPLQLDTDSVLTMSPEDVKKSSADPDDAADGAGSHGACLTLSDHDRIRQFIQEFTFRGLLPHIEKNIRQLNDQVASFTHRNMAAY